MKNEYVKEVKNKLEDHCVISICYDIEAGENQLQITDNDNNSNHIGMIVFDWISENMDERRYDGLTVGYHEGEQTLFIE